MQISALVSIILSLDMFCKISWHNIIMWLRSDFKHTVYLYIYPKITAKLYSMFVSLFKKKKPWKSWSFPSVPVFQNNLAYCFQSNSWFILLFVPHIFSFILFKNYNIVLVFVLFLSLKYSHLLYVLFFVDCLAFCKQ